MRDLLCHSVHIGTCTLVMHITHVLLGCLSCMIISPTLKESQKDVDLL